VSKYLTEVKELNRILINLNDQLEWENDPATISSKFPQTQDLIEILENNLNLTQIEFHNKIYGESDRIGFAYRFGNPETEKTFSFLIFTQNKNDLESFRHYEQFIDCGKTEIIENNWAFSRITVNCNN
jgi:hypothetical protein